jgi:hypothetical protein
MSKDPAKQICTYNQAVQLKLDQLHKEESRAYEDLQNTVQQLRSTADVPFEQQAPEVQAR